MLLRETKECIYFQPTCHYQLFKVFFYDELHHQTTRAEAICQVKLTDESQLREQMKQLTASYHH
jgi:hypothetical protein